ACQEARAAFATSIEARLLDPHRYDEALRIVTVAKCAHVASDDWLDYLRGSEVRPDRVCQLLREIVGPFRIVRLDRSWQTATTIAIAQTIYDSQDYTAMPILADAIEDAGCDDADILSHLRGPRPHARGCWLVDLLLAKE